MREEWRTISQCPLYEVSNSGKIRHGITKRLRYLRPNNHGYITVTLQTKRYSVHRLVAQAFLPNPDHLPMINHKDEDKTNNIVENLEWCNASYNIKYSGIDDKGHLATSKPVIVYDMQGKKIGEFASQNQAANALGTYSSLVSKCCRSKTHSSKGYVFRFKDDTMDVLKHRNPHYKRIRLQNMKDDTIIDFDTLRAASKFLNAAETYISKIAKGKGYAYGYYIKYI